MGDKKYKAFISYSHADEAWGGRLQGWLERFRAPGSLAVALRAQGKPARLTPVFRDREDLPVAGNLNSAIQAALADSEFQIVLCSPNAAKSRWVNEEIKLFHKLHGPGRVFALIVGGEPNATAIAGREGEECFPPALRFELDQDGNLTDSPTEPLAADARQDGDGKRYALLKVAAGMLGVGLDDLVRRDAARRARQAWTITSASLAGTAATAALAVFAIAKSNEATLMRGKAENLIEFMLTDLKDKLEPVGRLDVLESVVARAMDYYADQDPKSLNDDALARRAKAMMQLGTIDFRRNNLDAAQTAYETAEAATAELLRRSPNNPDRIFDHAQNVFYVGEVARSSSDLLTAEKKMSEYLRLAEMLVATDSTKSQWQMERAYATSNLGMVKFDAGEYEAASVEFRKSINQRHALSIAEPSDEKLRFAYAYAISWLAYADLMLGRYRSAIHLIEEQLAIYGHTADIQSNNFFVLDAVVTTQRRLAEAHIGLGELKRASAVLDAAAIMANKLTARDRENANWSVNASHIERLKSLLYAELGDADAAFEAVNRAVGFAESAIAGDNDTAKWYLSALGQALSLRVKLDSALLSVEEDARRIEGLLTEAKRLDVLVNSSFIGCGSLTLAHHERRKGFSDRAATIITDGIRSLEPARNRLPMSARIYLAGLYLEAGAPEKAAPILDELEALGVRHPDYLELRKRFQSLAVN